MVAPYCNTPGVWLPHLHLHFMNMSIIHSFIHKLISHETWFWNMAICCIFHVCCFLYEIKSVQHLSATCATYFSEIWLVNTMQQDHETCETWLWNRCNISCVFHCFSTYNAWFLCDQGVVWLIILLNNLVTPRMSFGTLFILIMLPK